MEIAKALVCGALLLTLGPGCDTSGSGKGSGSGKARGVQLFNCTKDQAFQIFARAKGGSFVDHGTLNVRAPGWTDCHEPANQAQSKTVDILDPPGEWEVRAVLVPSGNDPDCDSLHPDEPSTPKQPDEKQDCNALTFFFQTDVTAPVDSVDLTVPGG
jgi:hypothetical protein